MRELITTAFEVIGLALVAVALGMAAWALWPPLGVAVSGVALVGESWLLQRVARPTPEATT